MRDFAWRDLGAVLRALNGGTPPSSGIKEDIRLAKMLRLIPLEHAGVLVGLLDRPLSCVCDPAGLCTCESCQVTVHALVAREEDVHGYMLHGLDLLGSARTVPEIRERIDLLFPGAWVATSGRDG